MGVIRRSSHVSTNGWVTAAVPLELSASRIILVVFKVKINVVGVDVVLAACAPVITVEMLLTGTTHLSGLVVGENATFYATQVRP